MTLQDGISASGDPLREHLWRSRVVVVFASDCSDRRIAEQKAIILRMGSRAGERDMAVVEFVGATIDAQAMRRRLGAPESGFQAVLVGKDGGAKLQSPEPLTADLLQATIDAMPMRRQEMRRRR